MQLDDNIVLQVSEQDDEVALRKYESLPDGIRTEFYEGTVHYSASPTIHHQVLSGRLYAALLQYIDTHKFPYMPLYAPMNVKLCDSPRIVYQPDILVLCDQDRQRNAIVEGAPDLILEIVSPGTRDLDYIRKLFHYWYFGVREYWIVEPEKRTVTAYFFEEDPSPQTFSFDEAVPVRIFPGLNIGISELTGM